MEEEIENNDSPNVENPEADATDAPEKNELEEKNRQLFERAKKAETEARELKSKLKELSDEKPKEPPQSSEPDYAKLAYLKAHQVDHPDDQKVVMDEATRLKLPLTDVLQMEHIKAKLKTSNDMRVAQDGMPSGTSRRGGPQKGDDGSRVPELSIGSGDCTRRRAARRC